MAGEQPALGSHEVAYMLARDSLFPWLNALDNAAFGLKVRGVPIAEARERAAVMLKKVGLGGSEYRLPKALSHGMRQRVALARTFAMPSPLLLMDEPFGSLDAQTKLQLQDLLLQLCQDGNRTVLFVTHDVNPILNQVNRVLYLANGRFKIGTPDEVLRSEVLSDLYETPVDVLRNQGRIVVVGNSHDHDHFDGEVWSR